VFPILATEISRRQLLERFRRSGISCDEPFDAHSLRVVNREGLASECGLPAPEARYCRTGVVGVMARRLFVDERLVETMNSCAFVVRCTWQALRKAPGLTDARSHERHGRHQPGDGP